MAMASRNPRAAPSFPAAPDPGDETLESLFQRARRLAAMGREEDARTLYIQMLMRDAAHLGALTEFGRLAYASDHRAAARTAYEQAVRCHPQNAVARLNLGNILFESGEADAARGHYETALAADPHLAEAHRGLARVLTGLGEIEAADHHWRQSFSGQAVAVQRTRGQPPSVPMPVLVLVSARGGNIPLRHILDDRIFAVTALYAEFYDPAHPLPPHDLLFNAIGDADLCGEALGKAREIAARTDRPVINPPTPVIRTGRAHNAARLAAIPGVRAPHIEVLSRDALADAALTFPLLLRAPGFHTGQHFLRVESADDLPAACAALPGGELLAIEYLDARGADGLARKYRVMFIGGLLYPVHLAICADWKVHYFTAAMAQDASHREEERRFLEDMHAVLGPRIVTALTAIAQMLELDYGGIDFAVGADGSLLLFEANATMVLNPPDADPIWDYRRAAIGEALDAASRMLLAKSAAA